MAGGFLGQALVFLTAAIVCVPVARKIGMGSVLGYLVAGILIGPFVLGFVGHEGEDIMHSAEFGVVMMLFLIGLELNPEELWKLRKSIVGMGLMQMGITSVVLGAVGHLVFGWHHYTSLAIALALSMSSTAIIMQTLKEKGLSRTRAGQSSFSVLLFQDISVIPILAILPFLSSFGSNPSESVTFLEYLPAWLRPIVVLCAVAFIWVAGSYIVNPVMRYIARASLRELFTVAALLLVVAVSYLMQMVGLSPALGAFLAGVVLANSEYRHELESDLEPFKGLLLGLFFIGVGSTINFKLISEQPGLIMAITVGLVLVKGLVVYFTGKVFKIKNDQNLLFAFLLAQVGEFAFVLLNFSNQLSIVDKHWTEILMACTAISMALTPLLLLINERVIDPHYGTKETIDDSPREEITERHKVILAGFGHFGSTIGRFLRANGIEAVILDNNSDRVDLLRKMGFKVYYGDATRQDLLRSAGADEASLLIAAIDSPDINKELIRVVRKHFPHIHIMARARNRYDAYELIDMGVKDFYRETLYTSVHMAINVMKFMGMRAFTAHRKGMAFIRYDEEALSKLAQSRFDSKEYILSVREQIEMQEKLLSEDLHQRLTEEDLAWDTESLKRSAS